MHVNTVHLWTKKRLSKKDTEQIFMDVQQQQQQQEDGFSVVSLDESFFFYDSLVRRVFGLKRIKDQ